MPSKGSDPFFNGLIESALIRRGSMAHRIRVLFVIGTMSGGGLRNGR